jgi:uncharacterized sulfatase
MAQKAEIRSTLPFRIQKILSDFWGMALIYLLLMFVLRILELVLVFKNHVLEIGFGDVFSFSILDDFGWNLYLIGLLLIFHILASLFSRQFAKYFSLGGFTLALIVHISLIFYFLKTLLPLGKDLFAYSTNDLIMTVKASGQVNLLSSFIGIIGFSLIFGLLFLGAKFLKFPLKAYLSFSALTYCLIVFFTFFPMGNFNRASEIKRNIEVNKSRFLSEEAFDYFMYKDEYYFDFFLRDTNDDLLVKKDFAENGYPFLHTAKYPDMLSPFFDSLSSPPDIVFILVESLGKAYSGEDAYLGSFTPFLDSLELQSLVWTNAISSTGRTFGIQPGLFGGLPFGEKGFLELYDNFPTHHSLLSVLKENGYQTRYFIGADKSFDHVGDFLVYNQVDQIVDAAQFDPKYASTPSTNGFSWGYADKELFRNALEKLPATKSGPELRVFQTQTSHDPYIVPEPELYKEKLRNHLKNYLNKTDAEVADYLAYENIYMTLLYADDAIREFFKEYQKRPEFENTIFIITGDHRLPEVPMSSRLDRFHVPLLIYSPKINRPTYFKSMVSHFEVTPTILSLLEKESGIRLPEKVIWQGQVLDTASTFQSRIAMPLMRNKNQLVEYVDGDLMISDGQLFQISDGLNIDPIENTPMRNKLTGEFEEFKNKNNYIVQTRKLMPVK